MITLMTPLLFGLTMTLVVDLLALPWRLVENSGYTSGLSVVRRRMSVLVGLLLLAVCVPGAIIAIMVCFLRSWDDNTFVILIALSFVAGAGMGMLMMSEDRPV